MITTRVYLGTRTFGELIPITPIASVRPDRIHGALFIPRGTFHRSVSGPEGSIVINQAQRYPGFDSILSLYRFLLLKMINCIKYSRKKNP